MNTILVLLSLLCIVLLVNLLYSVVVSIYSVLLSSNRLIVKDDSSSANVLIQNVLAAEPETCVALEAKNIPIDLVTKKIPIRYGVVEDGAVLSQVKKRVLISVDFIHWLNSFRKQDVFVAKFEQNKNPAATELISLFSSGTPDTFALQLPNNTDLIVIKLLVDNNGIKSVEMYSSLPGCPGWASALVDAAAAAAAANQYEAARIQEMQKLLQENQERQKAAKTQEMQKLFQATYEALSTENKHEYAEWGKEDKNEHKLEYGDIASFIFLAHWACIFNNAACLEVLKAGGANFDIPDNKGYVPAHYAVENCYTECLEILRAGGANFDVQDNAGNTPVHYAAEDNCIECLKILKAGGANFNINNKKGLTPAHCVALFGSEACLELLKASGANFDIQDNNGQTAREIASKKGIKIDDL